MILDIVYKSKSALAFGSKVFVAGILAYYPAIWASQLKSRIATYTIMLILLLMNIYLMFTVARIKM